MLGSRYILGLCLCAALALPAFGADISTIRTQLTQGDYAAAYETAENLQTADGQALAAESLLSVIMLGQADKNKKQAKRARKFAEAALEIDPSHQNARLQYAIADGFITREASDMSAWMKKLPQKTHAIVQAYRDDFPDDPRGDALLGAWNLAIVRKTGPKNAQKWFGASIDEGQLMFLNARDKIADDIIIETSYAFALLALDDEDLTDAGEAQRVLTRVASLQPADNLNRVVQGYAKDALARIGERDAVRDYAGMFLDGEAPSFD